MLVKLNELEMIHSDSETNKFQYFFYRKCHHTCMGRAIIIFLILLLKFKGWVLTLFKLCITIIYSKILLKIKLYLKFKFIRPLLGFLIYN